MQPCTTGLAQLSRIWRAVDIDIAAHGVHVSPPIKAPSQPDSHKIRSESSRGRAWPPSFLACAFPGPAPADKHRAARHRQSIILARIITGRVWSGSCRALLAPRAAGGRNYSRNNAPSSTSSRRRWQSINHDVHQAGLRARRARKIRTIARPPRRRYGGVMIRTRLGDKFTTLPAAPVLPSCAPNTSRAMRACWMAPAHIGAQLSDTYRLHPSSR